MMDLPNWHADISSNKSTKQNLTSLASWPNSNVFVDGAEGSNLRQVKSDTVLPTAYHCCDIP